MDKQLLITNVLTISAFSIVFVGMFFYFRKPKESRALGTYDNKKYDIKQSCPYCNTDLKWKLISIFAPFKLSSSHKCPVCSKQIIYKRDYQFLYFVILGVIVILLPKYLFNLEGGTYQMVSSLVFSSIILYQTTKAKKHVYWLKNNGKHNS